jgi:hypothetical protein
MLSTVLRSGHAEQMSIDLIRAFVRLRQLIENKKDIAALVEKLEERYGRSDRSMHGLGCSVNKWPGPQEIDSAA